MGKNERQAYLKAIRTRYRRARKKVKVTILDEFCAVCGYHRKYAIRLLNQRGKPRRKRRAGRKPVYASAELLTALKRIWFASDQMCSKKLKAAIPLWLPFYETVYKTLTPETQDKLSSISAATIDRVLKTVRVAHGRKGLSGTKPGSLLKNQIPIRTHFWDVSQPGFMEADTVAHCGNSLAGDFVWSLTMTDILTTWTENRATWNKGAHGVLVQIQDIELRLPFALQGFDCDNGSEFLNYHLVRYFTDHPSVTSFTRSRPYRKNDNAHVEQKNWSHVRQLFGYDRFEDPNLVDLMNDLYVNEWSLAGISKSFLSQHEATREKTHQLEILQEIRSTPNTLRPGTGIESHYRRSQRVPENSSQIAQSLYTQKENREETSGDFPVCESYL